MNYLSSIVASTEALSISNSESRHATNNPKPPKKRRSREQMKVSDIHIPVLSSIHSAKASIGETSKPAKTWQSPEKTSEGPTPL